MCEQKMYVLIVEDSIEGILSGVSKAYKSRYGHNNIKLKIQEKNMNLEMLVEYISVETDLIEVQKVYEAIIKEIGYHALTMVEKVSISTEAEKADIIYRFLILGFANGKRVIDYFVDDNIVRVNKISNRVGKEIYHWEEFLRFKVQDMLVGYQRKGNDSLISREKKQEIMIAVIAPKNKILPYIMPHYADRYSAENFMIYDETYDMAGLHIKNAEWIIRTNISKENQQLIQLVNQSNIEEQQIQDLWKIFFAATDIKERNNVKVQNNLLPVWMRKNMTEFN